MNRPLSVWILAFMLGLLGMGGLYGGMAMVADPTGNMIQVAALLPLLPVSTFLLPGLFLITVLGSVPLLLAYALITRPDWSRPPGRPTPDRAWSGTIGLVSVLLVWLAYQGSLIGFRWPHQYVTLATGLTILLLALLPATRRFFAR